MSGVFSILIPVIVLGVGALGVMTFLGRAKGGGIKKAKNREAIVREAGKKLAQNPKDTGALLAMGDVHFQEQAWENVRKTYGTLAELLHAHPSMDAFLIHQRCGIAASKLNMLTEAEHSLAAAKSIKPDDFDVNSTLGNIEFQLKNYEKAIQLFQQVRMKDPEHVPTLRSLGHSLFKVKKYKEAMTFIRKAMDLAPDDKESFFTLASCYYEANQTDLALKMFARLRADPVMGPEACLLSGTINTNQRQIEKAIEDFELGLRHTVIKNETLFDLKYRLANVYIQQQEIGKAVNHLRDIQALNPGYKDVAALISRYQELNTNKNMQIYLMAPQNDFIALCRRVVLGYFPRAKVKISKIIVEKNEWVDLLAEVDTPKWSDVVMFRFIRNQGSVGEMIVRDFHQHLKEVKAGKGICVTIGAFSEEARRYTEARLIDLIDKAKLAALLNKVASSSPAAGKPPQPKQ